MKRIVQMFLLLSSAFSALAQGVLVMPGGLANTEGNSSVTSPFNSSSFRLQMVYDAREFATLGPALRFSDISFRIDGASSGNVLYSFSGGSVTLSTTTRSPDGLSAVFAENTGPNAVTWFTGAPSFGGLYQPGANPQPFGQNIPSTASFIYDPAQGNLLVDISGFGGLTLFPGALDAQLGVGDSVSRVFALNGNALSGTPDSLGLVTRFNVGAVPEPSTWALAVIGFALLFVLKLKCR